MWKWLILLGLVGLGVAAWAIAREYRITPEWDKPKFDKVSRGDIRVPISAPGLIEPYQRIEIKPKASGEVLEVLVKEGDYVKPGDVLVVLKRTDEERNVTRAKSNLEGARAALERAKVAVSQTEVDEASALGRIEIETASVAKAEFDLQKRMEMSEGMASRQEVRYAELAVQSSRGQLTVANSNLKTVINTRSDAQEQIRIQQAAVTEAEQTLSDAQERLDETTIRAKQEAIVTDVAVRVGNIVQSGIGTFTGGSVLVVLADISMIKVIARVDEADYGRVSAIAPVEALPNSPGNWDAARADAETIQRRGGQVTITVDAFPDKSFAGRISRVEPQGKLNAGSAIIQFDVHVDVVDDKRFELPLGTQAQVEFTVESVKDELVVAAEAVKTFQEQKGLWVRTTPDAGSDEQYGKKFIPCRFGITDGDRTHLIGTMGSEKLVEGAEIYTKLPAKRDDD